MDEHPPDTGMEITVTNLKVAFLGPVGTYSHQAAYDRFGGSAEYCEQETITDVFNAVLSRVHFGVVPQENSIFGNVIETYDNLRKPGMGFVRGDVTLEVQHCLLVQKGVKIHQIERILSHEQGLGQCRGFITEYLSSASLVKMPSTAAAAQALLSNGVECAAICSKLCATLFDGLEILHEGIQDENVNFTRFYIITTNCDGGVPPAPLGSRQRHALVRISSKVATSSSMEEGYHFASIMQLLTALGMDAIRVDRRPSVHAIPFHDVYFVELQEEDEKYVVETGVTVRSIDWWSLEVEQAIVRIRERGGEAQLLGMW